MYTIRVSVENGVSDQDELNTRSCEVTGSTGDTSKYFSDVLFCSVNIIIPLFDLQGLMHHLLFSVSVQLLYGLLPPGHMEGLSVMT